MDTFTTGGACVRPSDQAGTETTFCAAARVPTCTIVMAERIINKTRRISGTPPRGEEQCRMPCTCPSSRHSGQVVFAVNERQQALAPFVNHREAAYEPGGAFCNLLSFFRTSSSLN